LQSIAETIIKNIFLLVFMQKQMVFIEEQMVFLAWLEWQVRLIIS
jgi:hypothetical protein